MCEMNKSQAKIFFLISQQVEKKVNEWEWKNFDHLSRVEKNTIGKWTAGWRWLVSYRLNFIYTLFQLTPHSRHRSPTHKALQNCLIQFFNFYKSNFHSLLLTFFHVHLLLLRNEFSFHLCFFVVYIFGSKLKIPFELSSEREKKKVKIVFLEPF